jgi:hypothetical protein
MNADRTAGPSPTRVARPFASLLVALLTLDIRTFVNAADVPAPPSDAVWIEGEAATRKNVTRHNWYDDVKKDTLSGGEWLSHFNEGKIGTAEFDFEITKADKYAFWIRANPIQAKLSYQLDKRGTFERIDLSKDQRGTANIASDNKPDLRFITWVKVSMLDLTAGKHTIAFRMDSGPQNHGAIDCFTFVRIPFIPSGTKKPTLTSGPGAPDEWFPVVMDADPLSPESVIDISALIEAPAGQHGFLQRDGATLRFQNSTEPTRFWGVNAHPLGDTPDEMSHAARWMRKHGINIVRQHTVIDAVGLLDAQGKFNAGRLDRYDRWFAALKEQGIYSTWSVIYPHHGAFLQRRDVDAQLFDALDASDTDRDGCRGPIVVNDYINLDRRLQDAAWTYFETLLNHVNPHTGLAYKDDPALAVLEFQNESNVFFHTLNVLADPAKVPMFSKEMRQRFFEFANKKYGSKASAAGAWGGKWQNADNWERGELALMGAFHWGSDGPLYEYAGQSRRAGDYIEFLTEIQKDYFDRRQQQVRAAGFKGVTVATAWRSGGPAASLADLYTDTAADAIDRHNYFGGGDGGHRITEGKVDISTHLARPGDGLLNLGLFQVHDRPFAVSEWSQMPPNPWKAEAAPLYAFYGMGLQGWDAVYHFALGSGRMGDGWPHQGKYVTETPHYIGQFPALAFAVHNGHIQEGDVVALRRVSQADLFSGRDVLGQSLSAGGFDSKELEGRLTTPPGALAAGRVTVEFGDGESELQDLGRYIDQRTKTITSSTGELVWRYGDRIVEVRSPKTQGVIGFAVGKTIALPGATVTIDTPFVSLLLTPLDNLDLAASRHILITAMARDKQTGSEFNADWSQLTTMGGPPLLMEPVQATIKLAGAKPQQVRALDLYGVPKGNPLEAAADGGVRIDGRWGTYYYEIKR